MKMKRGKFYPSKFSKICSDHFTPDCINPGVGFGKPTLKRMQFNYFQFFTIIKVKEKERTRIL
ncbi:hypothetical protein Avbf_12898 [Armadillidium vulgare]|nr:hypothetical protein Avbf_12898 [Armadillidium vulgare]